MVSVFLEPGLFARELLEMPLRRLRATFLQALTKGLMPLAVMLNRLTTKGLTCTIGGKIDDAEINAKRPFNGLHFWLWRVQCHRKEERSITIDQIGLPFDPIHSCFLVFPHKEGNQDTARKGCQGHGR